MKTKRDEKCKTCRTLDVEFVRAVNRVEIEMNLSYMVEASGLKRRCVKSKVELKKGINSFLTGRKKNKFSHSKPRTFTFYLYLTFDCSSFKTYLYLLTKYCYSKILNAFDVFAVEKVIRALKRKLHQISRPLFFLFQNRCQL